jgi:hypothetical protein
MKSTMQHFPLSTEEGITDGHAVVRRHHNDTLTLVHYHVTIGGLKKLHRANLYDHEHHVNPSIVVNSHDCWVHCCGYEGWLS